VTKTTGIYFLIVLVAVNLYSRCQMTFSLVRAFFLPATDEWIKKHGTYT
jgi:hypothetical protein